jgi:hypothetical protein
MIEIGDRSADLGFDPFLGAGYPSVVDAAGTPAAATSAPPAVALALVLGDGMLLSFLGDRHFIR